ncbi:PTS sugar transporter subunit IIC [Clostridium saccharoperbutylacetonicum]
MTMNSEKVQKFAYTIQTNKYLQAISNGLMSALPVLMIGSFAIMFVGIPIAPWQAFLGTSGLIKILLIPYSLSIGCLGLYASFLIAYKLASSFQKDPIIPALLSVFCFLIVTPMDNVSGANMFSLSWFGVQGLFTGMIVALIATRLYVFLLDKKIVIKMPESVPATISNTFSGLIPAVIVGIVFITITGIFMSTGYGSFTQFIYSIIQVPLSKLGNNFFSFLIIGLIQMILWFFGMHGSLVVSSFITALYLPMDIENLAAYTAGTQVPHIITQQFYNLFFGIGGAGGTLGLCILMVFLAKSEKLKMLGKLSIIPGLFCINEPIVFGLPMVFNPIMAIPFIGVPIVQAIVAYLAIYIGLVPHVAGFQLPFGIPVVFSAFMQGGFMMALLQLALVVLSAVIYFPFFKKLDNESLLEEQEGGAVE